MWPPEMVIVYASPATDQAEEENNNILGWSNLQQVN
jgi:hypothetical protein